MTMNETLSPEQLREAFIAAADPSSARVLALTCSLLLVSVVLWLVYRRKLREEYTPIWIGVALALVLVSVRLDWLYAMTRAIGAWTPSSLVFFLGEVFLVGICLNYAVRFSRTGMEIKNLTQEVVLLRERLERLDSGERIAG
jgi:hypothetical protein